MCLRVGGFTTTKLKLWCRSGSRSQSIIASVRLDVAHVSRLVSVARRREAGDGLFASLKSREFLRDAQTVQSVFLAEWRAVDIESIVVLVVIQIRVVVPVVLRHARNDG